LWIAQGSASLEDYERIKRDLTAAGIEFYEYQE
jgi:hypothetical protein